jgi:hypothetical protein
VRMPGRIDGVDLARAIRARWPTIKVVLTSGYIQWPNSDVPAGVEFMPKPWRAPDVLKVAESAARSA